jgi:hypothetical protein
MTGTIQQVLHLVDLSLAVLLAARLEREHLCVYR